MIFVSGVSSVTEYLIDHLIDHGIELPRQLTKWQRTVIGCALRGERNEILSMFSSQFKITNIILK